MRQGQQNRRGRGRNRKSQNPLTRSFESTGPDVKLRGTPSHIAEKYMSLARDALSSGDPVLAENYMQHAEHYNRIIMSFREQQMSQGGSDPFPGGVARGPHIPGEPIDGDDFGDDDGDDFGDMRQGGQSDATHMPQPVLHQPREPRYDQPQRFDNRPQHNNMRRDNRGDQQRHHNTPRHDRGENRFDRHDRGDRGERHDRGDRQDRPERQDRQDRPDYRAERQDRPDRMAGNGEHRAPREDRVQPPLPPLPPLSPVEAAPEPPMQPAPPRRRERFQPPVGAEPQPGSAAAPVQHHQQPEFLRRPVRRPRAEPAAEDVPAPTRQPAGEDQE